MAAQEAEDAAKKNKKYRKPTLPKGEPRLSAGAATLLDWEYTPDNDVPIGGISQEQLEAALAILDVADGEKRWPTHGEIDEFYSIFDDANKAKEVASRRTKNSSAPIALVEKEEEDADNEEDWDEKEEEAHPLRYRTRTRGVPLGIGYFESSDDEDGSSSNGSMDSLSDSDSDASSQDSNDEDDDASFPSKRSATEPKRSRAKPAMSSVSESGSCGAGVKSYNYSDTEVRPLIFSFRLPLFPSHGISFHLANFPFASLSLPFSSVSLQRQAILSTIASQRASAKKFVWQSCVAECIKATGLKFLLKKNIEGLERYHKTRGNEEKDGNGDGLYTKAEVGELLSVLLSCSTVPLSLPMLTPPLASSLSLGCRVAANGFRSR